MPPSPILAVTEYGPRVVPGERGMTRDRHAGLEFIEPAVDDGDLPGIVETRKALQKREVPIGRNVVVRVPCSSRAPHHRPVVVDSTLRNTPFR